MRDAFTLAVIGVGVGLPTVFAVTRLMRNQLYGVQPHDPLTLVSVSVLLLIVVLAAAWLPAYRAARLDPIKALRTD